MENGFAASPYCPEFQGSFEFLGRRWTASILRAMFGQPMRFTDLLQAVPRLSTRLLSQRLDELVEAGIVFREADSPRPRYRLTPKGQGLRPVFQAVEEWNARWVEVETS